MFFPPFCFCTSAITVTPIFFVYILYFPVCTHKWTFSSASSTTAKAKMKRTKRLARKTYRYYIYFKNKWGGGSWKWFEACSHCFVCLFVFFFGPTPVKKGTVQAQLNPQPPAKTQKSKFGGLRNTLRSLRDRLRTENKTTVRIKWCKNPEFVISLCFLAFSILPGCSL